MLERCKVWILISVPLIWGGNFPISKLGIVDSPPLLFISARLLLTGLILLPFIGFPKSDFRKIIEASFTLGSLNFGFLIYAIHLGEANYVILLFQTNVVFGLLFAVWLYRERVYKTKQLGLVISFLGVVLVLGWPEYINISSACLTIFAAAMFGLGQSRVRSFEDVSPLAINTYVSLIGGLQLLIVALIFEVDYQIDVRNVTQTTIFALFYTSVVSGIVAYGLWYSMIKAYGVVSILPFNLLTPVFGICISNVLLDEQIGYEFLIGALLTIFGISLLVATEHWSRTLGVLGNTIRMGRDRKSSKR